MSTKLVDQKDTGEEQATQDEEEYSAWEDFKKTNKAFWKWFNLMTVFFSAGFMGGTAMVLQNQAACTVIDTVLYFVIALHTFNIVIGFINLIGCDWLFVDLPSLVCGIVLFEVGVLTFMQIGYFEAMELKCWNQQAADKYYWLAGQILIVYMTAIMLICYFFRRFCQDDEEPEDDNFDRDEESSDEEAPKKKGKK